MRTYIYNKGVLPILLHIWPDVFPDGLELEPKETYSLSYDPWHPIEKRKEVPNQDKGHELLYLERYKMDGESIMWETRIDTDRDVEYLRAYYPYMMEGLHVLEEDLIHECLKEKETEEPAGPVIVEFQTKLFLGERTCPRM